MGQVRSGQVNITYMYCSWLSGIPTIAFTIVIVTILNTSSLCDIEDLKTCETFGSTQYHSLDMEDIKTSEMLGSVIK